MKKNKKIFGRLFMILLATAGVTSLAFIVYVLLHIFPAAFKFLLLAIAGLVAWFFYGKTRIETPEEMRRRLGYTSDTQQNDSNISNIFTTPYQNYSPQQYIPTVSTSIQRTRTPSEKLHLQIDYMDNDGIETSREIVISKKSNVDDYYIRAKCLLRNEERTFIIHRVQHCFNPETGEFIQNIKQYVDGFYYTEPKIRTSTPRKSSNHVKREPVILHLEYINADNEFTERDIRISSSKRSVQYSDYFTAYCFLRKGDRQFKVSGIQKCVNTETGKIIWNIESFLSEFYDKVLIPKPMGAK